MYVHILVEGGGDTSGDKKQKSGLHFEVFGLKHGVCSRKNRTTLCFISQRNNVSECRTEKSNKRLVYHAYTRRLSLKIKRKTKLAIAKCFILSLPTRPFFQGRSLTYEMVTGESPGEDEESPPADEICLQKALTKEAFFVDFLRTDQYDEDGVRTKSKMFSNKKNKT